MRLEPLKIFEIFLMNFLEKNNDILTLVHHEKRSEVHLQKRKHGDPLTLMKPHIFQYLDTE